MGLADTPPCPEIFCPNQTVSPNQLLDGLSRDPDAWRTGLITVEFDAVTLTDSGFVLGEECAMPIGPFGCESGEIVQIYTYENATIAYQEAYWDGHCEPVVPGAGWCSSPSLVEGTGDVEVIVRTPISRITFDVNAGGPDGGDPNAGLTIANFDVSGSPTYTVTLGSDFSLTESGHLLTPGSSNVAYVWVIGLRT